MSALQQLLVAAGVKISLGTASGNSFLGAGTATAQYELASNGDINATTVNNTKNNVGAWISPRFNMAGYDCRVTLSAGAFSSGVNNTWQNLGTTRTWTVSQVGTGSSSATYTVENS
jgi:hypothetical protein